MEIILFGHNKLKIDLDDQGKIERLLELSQLLLHPFGYTINQLADKLGVSSRTAYRYIESFKKAGLLVDSTNGRFKLMKSSRSDFSLADLIHISQDEFDLINDVVNYFDDEQSNPELFKKLSHLLSNNTSNYKFINKRKSGVVAEIRRAIDLKVQIILHDYQSSRASSPAERCVEPIKIIDELNYVWCYEIESQKTKLFKIQRMRSVELTHIPFKFSSIHRPYEIDHFRISGNRSFEVSFSMTQLAYNLMIEEFPRTKASIIKQNNTYIYQEKVCGYTGVGRFLLGMIGEIKDVQPTDLINFLNEKLRKGFD